MVEGGIMRGDMSSLDMIYSLGYKDGVNNEPCSSLVWYPPRLILRSGLSIPSTERESSFLEELPAPLWSLRTGPQCLVYYIGKWIRPD